MTRVCVCVCETGRCLRQDPAALIPPMGQPAEIQHLGHVAAESDIRKSESTILIDVCIFLYPSNLKIIPSL